jgi:acetyl-CoA carboxylase carboxyl transferase subunit alpha
VIDDVIPEPLGGAHRSPDETIDAVGRTVTDALAQLGNLDPDTLRKQRQDKFLAMGKKAL